MGDYATAMTQAWEDEVATEAYYLALAAEQHGRARDALVLLAHVERATADRLAPFLAGWGGRPAAEDELAARGRAEAAEDAGRSWVEFLAHVVETYPAYVAHFEALEALAPRSERSVARDLTAHEVAVLDFARLERDADPASLTPLHDYLAGVGGKATGA